MVHLSCSFQKILQQHRSGTVACCLGAVLTINSPVPAGRFQCCARLQSMRQDELN